MPGPPEILELVNRFREHRESYQAPSYNETQVRREFVDPFFKALGWDVDNEQGYAEAYKDVIHEDSIKIGGSTKAPDYSFRIGGVRKFFVETKKPSVNIHKDTDPAFQLRRYAWSAKLPLSILTDFEELAVYDCRIRPEQKDKASKGRTLYYTFDDYGEKWDEIAAIFSRDAILKGSFDKYAQSNKKKRGTAEVDDAFLDEIELWRYDLAKNIALRNPDLSQREINTAVQKTIDRIIFLRICEDRGIERYGRLQGLNGPNIYPRLCELFVKADHRYNSGLFHFDAEKGRTEPPDQWTLKLAIDDKVLKGIISRLYYPDSPYEFSVLSADILGQVYEQFLGKVIRLTKGHQAKVEDKPEVKKAGGVYYTPTYIVDYIVQQTVGKLLAEKAPHEIAARTKTTWKPAKKGRPLTVLDPACGSGSFLIGAYQHLLDWYRDWYVDNNPAKHKDRIYQTKSDEWRLTTTERKRILLDHIYGVDIDAQAVEVTKLSLLLKVLEGETAETLQQQLFAKERALPDLTGNIKCGNSLIGSDFYQSKKQLEMFDEEERLRINVFDWEVEFVEIMQAGGGFDAVIGNPPYVRMEGFKDIKQYLRDHYTCHDERSDLYSYFIEREHGLLKCGGVFGMIVSNKFIRAKYGQPVRGFLESNTTIKTIVDLAGLPVFHGATVRTIILISENVSGNGRRRVSYSPPPKIDEFMSVEIGSCSLEETVQSIAYSIPLSELRKEGWRLVRPENSALLDRLGNESVALEEFLKVPICYGVKSGLVDAFVLDARKGKSMKRERSCKSIIRPYIIGRDVSRYCPLQIERYIIYTPHGVNIAGCKEILRHLQAFKTRLEGRATHQEWYELQQPQERYVQLMEQPKIVYPDIAADCRFTIDYEGQICGDTTFAIPTNDLSLVGILNSRVSYFYFSQVCAALEGPSDVYLRFKTQYVKNFPVPRKMPARKTQTICSQVQQILSLHQRQEKLKTAYEKTVLQRQIDATDRQIDQLVYELYGLTDDEIRIVEEATSK